MTPPDDVYTHGHHDSVLRSHRWRTIDNSAAYVEAEFVPGASVLDVGCGPGTITLEIAKRVTPGRVVGLDRSDEVIAAAVADASDAAVTNLEYRVGDVYSLDFPDDSFDVVHAHQVLQHLSDPVAALVEMRRVCRPGGIVAARDSDYSAKTWFPAVGELDEWLALYLELARSNDAEPDAGRHLRSWAIAAGLDDIQSSASTWCFATDADRAWWSSLWADRVVSSAFAEQARERGLATDADLQRLAEGWRRWGAIPDSCFVAVLGEIRGRC